MGDENRCQKILQIVATAAGLDLTDLRIDLFHIPFWNVIQECLKMP